MTNIGNNHEQAVNQVQEHHNGVLNDQEIVSAMKYFCELVQEIYGRYDKFRIACLNSQFTIKTVDYFLANFGTIVFGCSNCIALQKVGYGDDIECYGNEVNKKVSQF